MSFLSINSGSSSLKAALFDRSLKQRLLEIHIADIGEAGGWIRVNLDKKPLRVANHTDALRAVFTILSDSSYASHSMSAIGHRVVHGGEHLIDPVIIDANVETGIEAACLLAPMHNASCLAGIRAARKVFKTCPHIAVFDTAFHATLTTKATTYALPHELTSGLGIRRYGFHGISHEFVSHTAAEYLGTALQQTRLVSCHLGNGCSITAVENGRSVETSMGMTPLSGLIMGTRSGDLDPGVIIKLMRDHYQSIDQLEVVLNQNSGLLGMTGTCNMREIQLRADNQDQACRLAIDLFVHRARKYIGAYAAVMGGVDILVFTGGIGENSASIRNEMTQRFDFLGVKIDNQLNENATVSRQREVTEISSPTSRVKVLVVATDEEIAIAGTIAKMV